MHISEIVGESLRHTKTVVSLDLGKVAGHTGLTILYEQELFRTERNPEHPEIMTMHDLVPKPTGETWCDVVAIKRFPLNTPYPEQVDEVCRIVTAVKQAVDTPITLVIDGTGCGVPVVDAFRAALQGIRGVSIVPIMITAGDAVTRKHGGYGVPKPDLVGAVQKALGFQRLRVSAELEHAATLIDEARTFEAKQNPVSGYIRYAHREGAHDDLLLSLAMAVWFLFYQRRHGRMRTMSKTQLGL